TRAADDRARRAAESPRAEDRELGRRRPRQQVGRGDAIFELVGRKPPAPVNAKLAQQRDVRGRTTEADAADPHPLACDHWQWHPVGSGSGTGLGPGGRLRARFDGRPHVSKLAITRASPLRNRSPTLPTAALGPLLLFTARVQRQHLNLYCRWNGSVGP